MTDSTSLPFQVDLRGVIDLLSRHLYSSPDVFLRELLQNGRDAITARAQLDPLSPAGVILITPVGPDRGYLTVTDNGVGLTAEQATRLLATVGLSSKRDEMLNLRQRDYLGQFGIGLLSCFMVAEQISVVSRSAQGAPAIHWQGNSDGTFTIRELPADQTEALEIGTTVRLDPLPDERSRLAAESVTTLATRFGEYLPVTIQVVAQATAPVTITHPPEFLAEVPDPAVALALGSELLGAAPLAVVPVQVPGTGTRGLAFVLPWATSPGAHQAHRVYLGRMLLSERLDDLLPEWGFFVRCILDTTELAPTASREALVAGEALEHTRAELGAQLRDWLLRLPTTDPGLFEAVLSRHGTSMRALAVHDDDLARMLFGWLVVETSAGQLRLADLVRQLGRLRYAATVDEFRQIAAVISPDDPIINAGHSYEVELLHRLAALTEGVSVHQVAVTDELDNLAPPPLADRAEVLGLEQRAGAILGSTVSVSVRDFDPANLTALYVADPEVLRQLDRHRAIEVAPPLWASLVAEADGFMARHRNPDQLAPRLCLNWRNPLVRQLARLDDPEVLRRTIQLVHLQAKLASHRPMSAADRATLTAAMSDLVLLSLATTDPEGAR